MLLLNDILIQLTISLCTFIPSGCKLFDRTRSAFHRHGLRSRNSLFADAVCCNADPYDRQNHAQHYSRQNKPRPAVVRQRGISIFIIHYESIVSCRRPAAMHFKPLKIFSNLIFFNCRPTFSALPVRLACFHLSPYFFFRI